MISENHDGFTLIELMITLVISSIIIAAIFSSLLSQQKTYLEQEQVAEMQQNIRAAMEIMIREIRMAGYDPTGKAGAKITEAKIGQLSFSEDINADGNILDHGETIDFGFSPVKHQDHDRDGTPDTLTNGVPVALSLGRQTTGTDGPGGYQPIAEHIQAVEFRYLNAGGMEAASPGEIRTVQISLLARAGQPDRDFTHATTYTTASGAKWGPYNDHFRRRLLITAIECRNLGI